MTPDADVGSSPVESAADDAFDMAETTSCQEYGHLYEACVGLNCSDDNCRIRTCADCGDEYEE